MCHQYNILSYGVEHRARQLPREVILQGVQDTENIRWWGVHHAIDQPTSAHLPSDVARRDIQGNVVAFQCISPITCTRTSTLAEC